jgi:hypothetical protein
MSTYEVNVVNGQLVFAVDARPWDVMQLDPVAVDTFSRQHHAYRFIRGNDGKVSSLDVSNGWEHVYSLSFRRVAD